MPNPTNNIPRSTYVGYNDRLTEPGKRYPGFEGAGVITDPLVGSRHSQGLSDLFDARDIAFANQSALSYFGNTVAGTVQNAAGKALTGILFVPNLGVALLPSATGYEGTYMDRALNKGLVTLGTSISDAADNWFVRQASSNYEDLSLSQQLSRPEF